MAKLTTVIALWFLVNVSAENCERDKSRTVRNIVYQELAPLFKSVGSKIPYKCPFFKDRDRYLGQELHKEREAPNRWSCSYCGKAFIGELYLDKHLARRHAAHIYTDPDAICLADYCEIFRCDVHLGMAKPTFWDLALCMEDDMKDLAQDCQEMMSGCLPDTMNWNASKTLLASLNESVCSFLTCKKYYDTTSIQEEEPPATSYVVLSLMLGAGLIIYYCVAINYFWLDTFSDMYDLEDSIQKSPNSLFNENNLEKMPPPLRQPRRKHNAIQAEFDPRDKDVFSTRRRLDDMAHENGFSSSSQGRQHGAGYYRERTPQTDDLYTVSGKYKKEHKFSRRSPKEKSKSPSPNSVKARSKAALEKGPGIETLGAGLAPAATGGPLGMFHSAELSTQEEQLRALSEAGAKFMEKVKQQSKENQGTEDNIDRERGNKSEPTLEDKSNLLNDR